MPNGDRKDAHAAMRLRKDRGATWDTGWIAGEWWGVPLTDSGGPVGPAATPGELDAMIEAAEKERRP